MDRIGLLVSSANTLFHHDYTSFFQKNKMCIRGGFFCLTGKRGEENDTF